MMTIDEALEVLRKYYGCRTTTGCASLGDLCDRCEYDVDADTVTEALKTVLDNLPTQMSGTSEDTISRQAAIDAAVEAADEWDGGHSPTRAYMITNAINKIVPSVQAEQKKGYWIPVDDPLINGRCSVCGFESNLYEDDVYGYDYCPNCGARLEMVDE